MIRKICKKATVWLVGGGVGVLADSSVGGGDRSVSCHGTGGRGG